MKPVKASERQAEAAAVLTQHRQVPAGNTDSVGVTESCSWVPSPGD